ncbi:MAG: DEAD/DEAH box helicase, partial [Methylobacteriaceae bacterium]|nr:DEAD/DEAH box helicase [Methylobacteriaceae bacterium]
MRPSLLDPLFAPATALPGVGPKVEKLIDRLVGPNEAGARVVDVLFHLPHGAVDRRNRPKIRDAPRDAVVTLEVTVTEHRPPASKRGRAPYRVLVEDGTGDVELVFFLAHHGWIEKALPIGAKRWVSGKLELWDGHLQMVHPDRVLDAAGIERLPPVEPVYGLTEGLSPRILAKAAEAALKRVPADLPEWIDPALLAQKGWPDFRAALAALHSPATPEAVAPEAPARARLAYDEMLANQLALVLVRASLRRPQGRVSAGDGSRAARILAALPYELTAAQTQALAEIAADLASDRRMLRLLQGDVGSGKTIVALLAMTGAVEAGRQAALMAPTDILARQHFERIAPLAAAANLRLALVTGRDKASERRAALAGLAAGEIDIAIGTHALFQDEVAFRDLGLAVVDEQHRFGVHQRLALGAKGEAVDVLVMTATPIPRTLMLTAFGDMDVSRLTEKPAGRQPLRTVTM